MHTYRQEPVPHQQYAQELCNNLITWLKRKSRRLLNEWLEASLILIGLDLEPARSILEPLYSPDPRGQKPYEPVRMLRALLLMVLLKYTSITKWAEALKANPRLARMADLSHTMFLSLVLSMPSLTVWKMENTRSNVNIESNPASSERESIYEILPVRKSSVRKTPKLMLPLMIPSPKS